MVANYFSRFLMVVVGLIAYTIAFQRHSKFQYRNIISDAKLNVYDGGDVDVDDDAALLEENLRYYNEYMKRGLKRIQERNIQGALKDFTRAIKYSSEQPAIQLGVLRYCLGDYEGAVLQLKNDITILEKKKICKASELRLFCSASYNKMNQREQAIEILDNSGFAELKESRRFMKMFLDFYSEELPLNEILTDMTQTDEKDSTGDSARCSLEILLMNSVS
jgi:tetratricopeptide (TPR) repeat protein